MNGLTPLADGLNAVPLSIHRPRIDPGPLTVSNISSTGSDMSSRARRPVPQVGMEELAKAAFHL